ncbi:hypothetical protein B0H21DRAFT_770279 [Amylocystis lapponica]|nr:hypothetical protein B0H21DRAFT_770279 [Amylocystis lapponica]
MYLSQFLHLPYHKHHSQRYGTLRLPLQVNPRSMLHNPPFFLLHLSRLKPMVSPTFLCCCEALTLLWTTLDSTSAEVHPEADNYLADHQFSESDLQIITSHPIVFAAKAHSRGLVRRAPLQDRRSTPVSQTPVTAHHRQNLVRRFPPPSATPSPIVPPTTVAHQDNQPNDGLISRGADLQNTAPEVIPTHNVLARRAEDDGSDNEDLEQASRHRKKARRDRSARALDEDQQAILTIAYRHFKLMMCTMNAFPNTQEVDIFALDAWAAACDEFNLQHDDIVPDAKSHSLICNRASQVRGAMKTAARTFVIRQYKFNSDDDPSPDIIAANRALVETLKFKTSFSHIVPNERTTLCRNPIFASILVDMWFTNMAGDGMRYFRYFGSVAPLVLLALLLTVVENAIDEFQTGSWQLVEFRIPTAKPSYLKHLQMLHKWEQYMGGHACLLVRKELMETVRLRAKGKNIQLTTGVLDDLSDDDFAGSNERGN